MLGWQLLSPRRVVPSANAFSHQDGIDPFWIQGERNDELLAFRVL